MADIGRSSFIPRETPGLTPNRVRRKRTFHLFGFVATTMLVGSLALAGGVYFLRTTAEKKLDDSKQALIEQKSLFQAEQINEVKAFDQRLRVGEALLRNHISPLKIFSTLESITQRNIQFTAFTLEHTPSREILLTLEGETPEFKSLALEEIQFSEDQVLKDVTFNEVAVNEATDENPQRMVAFTLGGTVDIASVQYDGAPALTSIPPVFLEDEGSLSVEEITPTVLGDSVTNEL